MLIAITNEAGAITSIVESFYDARRLRPRCVARLQCVDSSFDAPILRFRYELPEHDRFAIRCPNQVGWVFYEPCDLCDCSLGIHPAHENLRAARLAAMRVSNALTVRGPDGIRAIGKFAQPRSIDVHDVER